jgi:hypothetical protein
MAAFDRADLFAGGRDFGVAQFARRQAHRSTHWTKPKLSLCLFEITWKVSGMQKAMLAIAGSLASRNRRRQLRVLTRLRRKRSLSIKGAIAISWSISWD